MIDIDDLMKLMKIALFSMAENCSKIVRGIIYVKFEVIDPKGGIIDVFLVCL